MRPWESVRGRKSGDAESHGRMDDEENELRLQD
jgi:hypothetical protein